MSIIYLLSRKDYGLAKSMPRAARMFVFIFVLSVVDHSSIGTPQSEQGKGDRATCFLDEVHHPQAGKIADATVFIAVVGSDGTLASEGTGFRRQR